MGSLEDKYRELVVLKRRDLEGDEPINNARIHALRADLNAWRKGLTLGATFDVFSKKYNAWYAGRLVESTFPPPAGFKMPISVHYLGWNNRS